MKRIFGSILCILAIFLIVGKLGPQKATSLEHQIQDWVAIGAFLAIGIPLSLSKTKKSDSDQK